MDVALLAILKNFPRVLYNPEFVFNDHRDLFLNASQGAEYLVSHSDNLNVMTYHDNIRILQV